jgi:phage-related protein
MTDLKRGVGVSIALAVMLLAVGCSSSSTPASVAPSASATAGLSPSDYVVAVCGAFQDYADSVRQRQGAFTPTGSDIAAVKQSWLDFLDGMITDTQTLVTKIEAIGVPDVSDGQAAASTLNADFSKLQSDLQKLRDQSADLPTTSPAAFTSAFRPLLTQFQTDVQGFGQDLNQFSGGALDAAFSAAPECANVGASTSA